jgi:hypothetical protein
VRPRRLRASAGRARGLAALVACFPSLLVLLAPTAGAAQVSDSALRVEVISCVLEESAVDVTEMLAIARAELAPRELGQRQGERDPEPLLRVDACHDEYLLLRPLRPVGPEQRIALHDVPLEQRPRVAALALAELVVAALAPARAPEVAPPKPAAPPKAEAALPFPDWNPVEPEPGQRPRTIGVGAEVRLFTDSLGFSYGPRLDLGFRHLDVSLLGLFGYARTSLGQYRTGAIAISPSYALYRSQTRARFDASLGADLGVTWGSAQPNNSSYGARTQALGPFVAGFVQLALSGPLANHTFARIAVLGGYALGTRAREGMPGARDMDPRGESERSVRPEATTQGPFASLVVGLAWAM